jgi:hypothetical protein
MEKIPGKSTPEGTAHYCEARTFNASSLSSRLLGKTGWRVMAIGFGGYRIGEKDPTHEACLSYALKKGCNLIDTASVYYHGGSEKLIGRVVSEGISKGNFNRSQLVIMSKLGYIQGDLLETMKSQQEKGPLFPHIVPYNPSCWHCIHPDFLEDQLQGSLTRLNLDCLDLCLLHNPEYYFKHCLQQKGSISPQEEDNFYHRLRLAFAYLEKKVQEQKIQFYGISSNSLKIYSSPSTGTLSLKRVLKIAEEVGGENHHCRVAQVPLNLVESEAAICLEEEEGTCPQSLLDYASSQGVSLIAHRPLNALKDSHIIRLHQGAIPSSQEVMGELPTVLEEFAQATHELKLLFPSHASLLAEAEALFHYAYKNFKGIPQWDQWKTFKLHKIRESLKNLNLGPQDQALGQEKEAYLSLFSKVLAFMESYFSYLNTQVTLPLERKLNHFLPESLQEEPLSKKAIWSLACTPGIDAVLCGMRSIDYVNGALDTLRWPSLNGLEILKSLATKEAI